MAVAALVLGIASCVSAMLAGTLVMGILGIAAGIVAIILGSKAKKLGDKPGMATAGLVLGIIGLVLSGLFTLVCAICYGAVGAAAASGALDSVLTY
jgi:uncharacterized membrane protein HdeD (DUF308 family)